MCRLFQHTGLPAVAASALLLFGAAACGSGESGDKGGAASGSSARKVAFPVTLTHKYGATTVKSEPKRIVTVGLSDQDAVLALGKVPVGTTEWLGGFTGATGPWTSSFTAPAPSRAPALTEHLTTGRRGQLNRIAVELSVPTGSRTAPV